MTTLPSAIDESWKLFKLLVLLASFNLVFTQATISFSIIGLFVLAKLDRMDNVYARIICQMRAVLGMKKEEKFVLDIE